MRQMSCDVACQVAISQDMHEEGPFGVRATRLMLAR